MLNKAQTKKVKAVREGYKELKKAATVFKRAIGKYARVAERNGLKGSVGFAEWCEDIDDTLFDVVTDVQMFEVEENLGEGN